MSNNSKKTPLAATLNRFVESKNVDAYQLLGKALPCSVVSVNGGIVTVKFEINSTYTLPHVTIPVAGSIYVREPIQVGDFGLVVPADVYLGGVSGLGGGTANLTQRANLSALVFQPITNVSWGALPDSQKLLLQGPTGAIVQDMGGDTVLTVSPGAVTITIDGVVVWTVTNSGVTSNQTINTTGDVISKGKVLATHLHTGVQSGTSDTGPPA